MRKITYRVLLTPDNNDTFLVTCPDLPEVTTFGDDRCDALKYAVEAIETALVSRLAHKEPIPAPAANEGIPVTVEDPRKSIWAKLKELLPWVPAVQLLGCVDGLRQIDSGGFLKLAIGDS